MQTLHVVVQTKEDYDREQTEKLRLFFKIAWWGLSSFLFASLIGLFVHLELSTLMFGFIILFMVADLTSNRTLRSYIRAFFGVLYGIWGIGAIFFSPTIGKGDSSMLLIAIGIGIFFLWLAYKNISKYTNLIDVIKYGLHRRGGGNKPRYGGHRELHKAICFTCGRKCEVPFRPVKGRRIYCRDCYLRHKRNKGNVPAQKRRWKQRQQFKKHRL
ncbi:MAG TPA: CxxC-x17-CxxC domain-containing protein [Candidatus Nanoarchaeia archaeon]|nr:CxxC-x17-CxxC domain-containing protein [Candidatus Nanoarchaeia archaeon]